MINVPNSIIIHIEIDKIEREDFFKMFFLFIFLPPEFIFEPSLGAHLAPIKSPLMNKDKIS